DITDGTSNTVMLVETLKGDGNTKAVTVKRQHVALTKAALKNLKDSAGVQEFKDGKKIAGNRGASWMDGRFLQTTTNAARALNDPKPDVDCGGEGGLAGPRSLRDFTTVAMADGSVRGVSSQVSLKTWQAVSTRAGGEVIGNDW